MNAWLAYAGAALIVTLLGAAAASLVVVEDAVGAVWFAAGVAWALQLVAFAALVAVRTRQHLFLLGWLGGLVLRFGAVGVLALWLSRRAVFPMAPALLSLVAFVFVLLLLEPVFLRKGLQPR